IVRFVEVIGFSRARVSSVLIGLVSRLVPQDLANWKFKRQIAEIRLGISPHAPYTVSPELLRYIIGMAVNDNLPVAMHLAESQDELALLDSGDGRFRDLLEERSMWDPEVIPHGSRPLDYLQMLAGAPRALVIHGNYLDGEEIEFLAGKRDRM